MSTAPVKTPWHAGISRYQWLVLAIASLGWVFDVFEGQIFVSSMNQAMPELLPGDASDGDVAYYNNIALGAFLLGGALGGVMFGVLSDRIGRVLEAVSDKATLAGPTRPVRPSSMAAGGVFVGDAKAGSRPKRYIKPGFWFVGAVGFRAGSGSRKPPSKKRPVTM